MKKSRRLKKVSLSNSRWLSYAAAGAASSFTGAATANAEIHYSGILNLHFFNQRQPDQKKSFPLAPGASFFFERDSFGYPYVFERFGLYAAGSIQVRGRNWINASRLGYGVNVSDGSFYNLRLNDSYVLMRTPYGSGNFNHAGEAFIGFKFNQGNGTQYGWARLKMGGRIHEDKFIVKDYAWADPGESIFTGQKSSGQPKPPIVPTSGSLGVLAFGSAALLAWRKRTNDAGLPLF